LGRNCRDFVQFRVCAVDAKVMRAWALLIVMALLGAVVGCRAPESPPNLLNVLDVAPRDVDVGDRLEVIGTGFPEGKPATLGFHGTLYRPGDKPRDIDLEVPAQATSPNRISVVLDEALQAELCGKGDDAKHTTFRGEVVAAFAPRNAGAPPVTGTVHEVVLDVSSPTLDESVVKEREAEGHSALSFLGLHAKANAETSALTIKGVDKKGRGARAGLQPGDVLLDFDGVSVRSASDVIPSGATRFATISVQRGRLREPVVRRIDVQGFQHAAPSDLAVSAVLIGLAVSILLLFMGPLSRLLTWTERRVAQRLKASAKGKRHGARGFFGWVLSGLSGMLGDDLLPSMVDRPVLRLVPYLIFLGASAAFTMIAFGHALVAPDLDLAIVVLSSLTALATIGLMLGGWRSGRGWSLVSGVKAALSILSYQLPALAAIACVVMTAGSTRLSDIVEAQGAAPWHWFVFASPVLLLCFMLLMVTALPEANRALLELPEADSAGAGSAEPCARATHPATRCLMFLAEWGHVFLLSGVAATLFLGGWSLPFVPPLSQQSSVGYQALGALLLQLKCWALVLFVLWIRWALPRLSVEQMLGVCWRVLVPLSVLAIVLSGAWLAGLASPVLRSVQGGVRYVLFALSVFVVGYFTLRVLTSLRTTSGQMNVNPWL
jgi:NADH-quinone oxidoreductase subunit H